MNTLKLLDDLREMISIADARTFGNSGAKRVKTICKNLMEQIKLENGKRPEHSRYQYSIIREDAKEQTYWINCTKEQFDAFSRGNENGKTNLITRDNGEAVNG